MSLEIMITARINTVDNYAFQNKSTVVNNIAVIGNSYFYYSTSLPHLEPGTGRT